MMTTYHLPDLSPTEWEMLEWLCDYDEISLNEEFDQRREPGKSLRQKRYLTMWYEQSGDCILVAYALTGAGKAAIDLYRAAKQLDGWNAKVRSFSQPASADGETEAGK